MKQWKLVKRKISELRAHPKNPRTLSKNQHEHLKSSIAKFGMADKPIINSDNMIIGGHQRLKLLKEMKVFEIECWAPEEPLTTQEVDELNIRLNKNTGDWDWDCLANEWGIGDLLNWGFTEKELLNEEAPSTSPRVTIVFDDSQALQDAMPFIRDIEGGCACTVKIKE